MSEQLRQALTDPVQFSHLTLPEMPVRRYQQPMMRAVWKSVTEHRGGTFVVAFSRQAGKDETIAQLVVSLLSRHRRSGGSIVIAAPTDEQAGITLTRVHDRAMASPLTRGAVTRRGSTVAVGRATASILSAAPTANVRGHTASLLLIANEAQDIEAGIWDARFAPMGASTNATTLFSGTVWDSNTLLAREMEHARDNETDGDRRLFLVPWREVAEENPAYGDYVRNRISQLGADHPFIQTEYELRPLDAASRLFGDSLLAHITGDHERQRSRSELGQYAVLIDVAGEEEIDPGPQSFNTTSKRDSTAATVVEIVATGGGRPAYRVVDRRLWTGVRHVDLHSSLHDLIANVWRAPFVVLDAGGVGAGITSMLRHSLTPQRTTVIPHHWTAPTKSQAGWDLIALIGSGRLKDYRSDGDPISAEFWRQMTLVQYETVAGPGNRIRWSVPSSAGHDDLVMSLALISRLDAEDLRPRKARGV